MIERSLSGLLKALKIIEFSMTPQEIKHYFGIQADVMIGDALRLRILEQPPEVIFARTEQYLFAKEESDRQAQKMQVMRLAKEIGAERLYEIVDWLKESEEKQDGRWQVVHKDAQV